MRQPNRFVCFKFDSPSFLFQLLCFVSIALFCFFLKNILLLLVAVEFWFWFWFWFWFFFFSVVVTNSNPSSLSLSLSCCSFFYCFFCFFCCLLLSSFLPFFVFCSCQPFHSFPSTLPAKDIVFLERQKTSTIYFPSAT